MAMKRVLRLDIDEVVKRTGVSLELEGYKVETIEVVIENGELELSAVLGDPEPDPIADLLLASLILAGPPPPLGRRPGDFFPTY